MFTFLRSKSPIGHHTTFTTEGTKVFGNPDAELLIFFRQAGGCTLMRSRFTMAHNCSGLL
jgi:hypothetical protein